MALCSAIAVERESKWEVGPTNDVVQAFIETLVAPRLPYKFSINDPPSEEGHRSIARQMHAVVLLYNYYHRKQKLGLKFLDFVSFCKLALSLKPTLKPFLVTIHGSEAVELNGSEDRLSVTEKAVKSACDIAMSLDASKDAPTTEGYPISTVAVLLIDSERENCLLKYNAVTEGAWSLIEKEINEFSTDQEIQAEERAGKKRKLNDHSNFLQIGFDAVKDVAGIEVSDLVVLEAHVVYSLSKEKSAAQFYMMKCNQSFDIRQRFALDSLVESLQGPFAEKYLDTWVTTSLIEYHRLLPYAELISSWLPRKDSSVPILSDCVAQIIKNKDAQNKIPASSLVDLDYININNNDNTERKASTSDKVANGDGKASQRKHKHLSGGKVASPGDTDKHKHATDVPETTHENVDHKGIENHVKGSLPGHSRGRPQRVARDAGASRRMKSTSDFFKTPVSSGEKEKMNSSSRSYHQSKNISSTKLDANGGSSKVEEITTDLLKSNDGRYRDGRLTAENSDTSNQNGDAAVEENAMVIEAPYNAQVETVMHSEDLQNALALLCRKRQELYTRLCSMEDTLALYEHVADRVRDGGEAGFARQCIEYLVSGKDHLLLQIEDPTNPQPQKQTRFSNTYLPGISSCQDLEYACLKNNWRLPRYFVQPSNGKFVANVVVHCMGVALASKGDADPTPREARESAAAQMIEKIRVRL